MLSIFFQVVEACTVNKTQTENPLKQTHPHFTRSVQIINLKHWRTGGGGAWGRVTHFVFMLMHRWPNETQNPAQSAKAQAGQLTTHIRYTDLTSFWCSLMVRLQTFGQGIPHILLLRHMSHIGIGYLNHLLCFTVNFASESFVICSLNCSNRWIP